MPEDIHMRLRRLRSEANEGRGFTQQEVAEKLGVAEQTVSAWELGPNAPSRKMQPKVAILYGVPVQYLLTGSSAGASDAIPPAALKPIIDRLKNEIEALEALVRPVANNRQKAGMPHKMVLPKSDTVAAKDVIKRRR